LFNQSDVLLLDHRIIVSKHTVEAAGFIFNNKSRDPKSRFLILDRQAKDQLHTGKYADPSPELIEQTKSVPKTNTVSERDFGSLYFVKFLYET
jgi:putative cell wall-binding protein